MVSISIFPFTETILDLTMEQKNIKTYHSIPLAGNSTSIIS